MRPSTRIMQLLPWAGTRGKYAAGICLLVTCCLLPAVLAQILYVISGGVKQPDGFPASHVVVKITSSTGLNWETLSDDMGRFEIPNLPRGRYYLTAENPADADQFMDQLMLDLGRDMTSRVTANLFLRYRSKVVEASKKPSATVSVAEETLRVPKAAQKSFDQALALRGKGKYGQSLDSFNKAIQIHPDYFQAISERGHLYIAMNQPALAAKDFTRALEIIPRYGPALRGAGLCAFQQGRYVEAIGYLKRAADAEPGNATNYLFIGAANLALDQREQAHAALLKALSLDPTGSARAHVHLANLYLKENRRQEALAEIEAYLTVVPKAPDAAKLRQVLAQLQSSGKP
jgi:tetratricopeptide (TPR) repeat protein